VWKCQREPKRLGRKEQDASRIDAAWRIGVLQGTWPLGFLGSRPENVCQAYTSLVALLWLKKLRRFPNEEVVECVLRHARHVVLGHLGGHLGKAHLPTG
jgi:hypothetical protein